MKNIGAFCNVFFILSLFISCNDETENIIEEITDDCFLLSNLRTHSNYLLPFKLYHDLDSGLNRIILNNTELELKYGHSLEFEESGYYEMVIIHTDENYDTILFTLVNEERSAAEWGIPEWVPESFMTTKLLDPQIIAVYPSTFIGNTNIPFVFYIMEGDEISNDYAISECLVNSEHFNIKRGVGSVNLSSDLADNNIQFIIGGNPYSITLHHNTTSIIELTGELSSSVTIPENSLVHITGNLTISSGSSLIVNAGSTIIVDEGINILNNGPVIFSGTMNNPILVTCASQSGYWGGFISNGPLATIGANYTFFCRSGYHEGGEYAGWGHAQCQALFYTNESELDLSNCYILDNKGQIFYPHYSLLNVENSLIQRAKTGGQINYCTAALLNCIFTDFPDDSQHYIDNDNDALYINASDVNIENCTFMYAHDDGMDSGLDEGGTVTTRNSRFEACFHEGAALSSRNRVIKNHTFINCTFYNCGQGIELGFSSPNHTVIAENCDFLNNGVGIRYGDNYEWSLINGQMYIRNSRSFNNSKDVWNMVRMYWNPLIDNLQFENTQISEYSYQYPALEIVTQ